MTNKSSGGIGLGGVLFIVFLVLKLTNNIDWSWWWVTAPLWMPLAFVTVILGLAVLGVVAFVGKQNE
jgi:membrane protein YdbS with pleckstrin-like domain